MASNTAKSTVYFHTLDLDSGVAGTGHADTYIENGAAVAIASGAVVTDSTPITSATITAGELSGRRGCPRLHAQRRHRRYHRVAEQRRHPRAGLATAGGDTAAQWQAALDAVTYADSSDNPNTATRDITVVLNDGTFHTNTAHATIAIQAVNDAPAIGVRRHR